MVGLFSKFSVSKSAHRRTRSAFDEREVLPSNAEATVASVSAPSAAHGIEVSVEFKPVEHPTEPLDNDKPVQCPLPEPSILNDGRIWKERVSAASVRRAELPLMKDGEVGDLEVEAEPRTQPAQSNRMILPSVSAPEHHLHTLLEECNAFGIHEV